MFYSLVLLTDTKC